MVNALKQNVHSSTDQSVIKGSLKNMHNVSQWFVLHKKNVWIREIKITGVMITHEDTAIVFFCAGRVNLNMPYSHNIKLHLVPLDSSWSEILLFILCRLHTERSHCLIPK